MRGRSGRVAAELLSRASSGQPLLRGLPPTLTRRLVSTFLALALSLLQPLAAMAEDHFDIVYPRLSGFNDQRTDYIVALIDLAMREAGASYTLKATTEIMERNRALEELATGRSLNLFWTSMGGDEEAKLRPIYFPLTRGLLGQRVLIVRKDRVAQFATIDSLDALKPLTGGQGLGWLDTRVLRNAGLTIEASSYDLLFAKAQAGRIDYYPRGLFEAYSELRERRREAPDLVVEGHLLLSYRSDWLFFTDKRDEKLARAIEQGLERASHDGSFQRLFNSHPLIQDALHQSDLKNRTVIHLDNPFLTPADRAIAARYWTNW